VTVVEELVASGRRLFSARSLLPLSLVPVILLAIPESVRVERTLGFSARFAVQWGALCLAWLGTLLRCAAVAFAPDGTSSRDTHALRAPSLNSTGMYSVMRHPLYAGNGLMWIGAAISTRVWWLAVIVGLAYALYIERVIAFEESFLQQSFGDAFSTWAARTPAFSPKWALWTPPRGRFAWRRLASEHNGLLAIATAFVLLQLPSLANAYKPADWIAEHDDLLIVLLVSVITSCLAIAARRSRLGR
jgi:protein-S-isoprenylcysteine O-methyltransferase Ste14